MSTLLTLVLTKLRTTTERAFEWLTKSRFQTLFLHLPEDMTNFVDEYLEREMSKEDLWQSYSDLTGLQEPYINALRYRMDPLLETISQLKGSIPRLEVYCYQDLRVHIDAHSLSERFLLLETSERVRSKIRISDWRELLEKQLELGTRELDRVAENISLHAEHHPWNVILYDGTLKPFKTIMESMGFMVKIIHLHNYWRSPLEVLAKMARTWGVDNLPDRLIMICIENHLRYLDYVLSFQNIDSAHDRWVSDVLPMSSCVRKQTV
ncbi:MAG: hypothetical protein ACFE7R_04405 [Candidatus Hodarchaeota archaeon]